MSACAPLKAAREGLADVLPAALASMPIGLVFGSVAATRGLAPAEVTLMSLLVFAGGAQFAAVELWTQPVPVAAIIFSTLLINLRHLLMGVSIGPKLTGFRPPHTAFAAWMMADENWALAERRHALGRKVTPAYWIGGGVFFVANWVTWSTLGAVAGALMGDPQRLGADFAFTAIFVALVVGAARASPVPPTFAAIVAALVASAGVHRALGPPWHVAAGAAAGIAAAALAARPEPATGPEARP